MSAVELTIKGDIEVLRLQPGDTIVVTMHLRLSPENITELRNQVKKQFPNHEVIFVDGRSLSLGVQREVAVA